MYWWHHFWTANNQEEISYLCDEDDEGIEHFEQYLVNFYQWDEDQYTDKYDKIFCFFVMKLVSFAVKIDLFFSCCNQYFKQQEVGFSFFVWHCT